jgi:hypothetical protein
MKNHKRPHYVPQLYWRGFSNNKDQVAILQKETFKVGIRNIRNITVERDFFTLEGAEDASAHYGVDIRSSLVDEEITAMEPAISEILKKLTKVNDFGLIESKEEIRFLIEWMAWIWIANPIASPIN